LGFEVRFTLQVNPNNPPKISVNPSKNTRPTGCPLDPWDL
jgi:hypothetical protein